MLAAALKELVADQLIQRVAYDEIPPHVDYRLTEKGQSVTPILQTICQWSGVYYREEGPERMSHCQKCDYRAR